MHAFGRRRQSAGLDPTVHFAEKSAKLPEESLTEKAQEYDRALRQSQIGANARRRTGMGASAMVNTATGPSASSIFGGLSTAQSAVLGDSQGSVQVDLGARTAQPGSGLLVEDLESDSLVAGSGLGGPYVDGTKRSQGNGEEEEEDGLQDGGVLGLLAQIYGRKEGGGAGGVL